ncbi:acyl carrier protein [Ruminococcus sp.]|uniref:phosphopantetheine-binding protein n=1 Tax=Ruminococcus sp. TaxID=41978 RepID=UPI00258C1B7F|nr:acyl carrier protein [Ruminococcus sp.]MCR5020533.1 acyl carrier protein [Ruminococcus sp.]
MNVKEKIIEALTLSGSYLPLKNKNEDLDLREYIIDSIGFMSFIIELEEVLGIYFPDELLDFNVLSSLNGFTAIIEDLIQDHQAESQLTN